MVAIAIKRDGRREDFIPEKIIVSALKSAASPEVARRISEEVRGAAAEEMETREIRDMVLEKLGDENPEWRENWLLYDRAVKRR